MDSGGQIKIISDENIIDSIFWHKRISLGRKNFGLLIGNVIEQGETSIIYIEAVFPVGRLSNARDILEDAKWLDIRSKAIKKHPGKEIVGWYGVRNNWGAMMMEEDQYIHKNYFMGLWQVMYLLDDKGGFQNFYIWDDDSLKLYKQDHQDRPLELLKEGRDMDMKTGQGRNKHYKWAYALLAVAILAIISYPKYIRPLVNRQQADKGGVESVSSDGEQSDPEVEEPQDATEVATLKEVIEGLENALDERAQELEIKERELEEKSRELEEKEQQIKKLEEAKAKAESGQDSSEAKVYQLKEGDTLSGISNKFYGSPKYGDDLGRINRITEHKLLRAGSYLAIPSLEAIEDIHARNTTSQD